MTTSANFYRDASGVLWFQDSENTPIKLTDVIGGGGGGGGLSNPVSLLTFTGAGPHITHDTASVPILFKGNMAAGDSGSDFTLNTTVTRTAGKLLAVQNNTTEVVSISYAGNYVSANGTISASAGVAGTTHTFGTGKIYGPTGATDWAAFGNVAMGASYADCVVMQTPLGAGFLNAKSGQNVGISYGGSTRWYISAAASTTLIPAGLFDLGNSSGGRIATIHATTVSTTGNISTSGGVVSGLSGAFGESLIDSRVAGYAHFSHSSHATSTSYAVRQYGATGDTTLNGVAQTILAIGGASKWILDSTGLLQPQGAYDIASSGTPCGTVYAGAFDHPRFNAYTGDGLQVPNLEAVPVNVRVATQFVIPELQVGDGEAAAIYIKQDPTGGTAQQLGIYGEITSNQTDTVGALIKVIHEGHGDAVFVALFDNGVAYESASFADSSRGIISTIQSTSGPNSVCFISLRESTEFGAGSGHGIGIPNLADYLADNAIGNAFVVRKWKQSGVTTPALDGYAAIKIVDHPDDGDTLRLALGNDGSILTECVDATSGTTTVDSATWTQRGKYWDGAATANIDAVWQLDVTATTPAARVLLSIGGTVEYLFSQTGIDMQGNSLDQIPSISPTGTNQITFNGADLAAVNSITCAGTAGTTAIDMQLRNIVAVRTITFETAATTGIDFQTKGVANIGAIHQHSSGTLAYFGGAPASKTTVATITNNVTSGGTTDVIDDWTDLSTYANDAAAIRNAVYQLSRKQKEQADALISYGLI